MVRSETNQECIDEPSKLLSSSSGNVPLAIGLRAIGSGVV